MDPKDFPAFPVLERGGDDRLELGNPGMTLRDYFAAAAMQSASANPLIEPLFQKHGQPGQILADWLAHAAYVMADAMLKARTE